VSQGKQRWPEKRYDRGVEWEEGVLPERSERFSSTRDLLPLKGHRLTLDNAMIICATWQRGFVSPLCAITLLLCLSSAIHDITSPWLLL
jgi:hypothetical protein